MKKIIQLNKNRVIFLAVMSSVLVGAVIISVGMAFYHKQITKFGMVDTPDDTNYEFHYAIISKETDIPFWQAIYEGAVEKGRENNIYVENIGSNLSADFTLDDLMKIAISSKVDAIILEPDGAVNTVNLINQADEAGIPVITMIKDEPVSRRKSFIGINSYNQGQAYGEQVLELVNQGRKNIQVLLSSDYTDSNQAVIYSGILEILSNSNVNVESEVVDTHSTFSAQEDVRNIIMDTENPPDTLVCLSAIDTLCAYQAVVDYNKVGAIDIIGYYDSDIILRAIEKKIVYSTMTIDAVQMGAYCVEALMEYQNTGRVSDYYSVDLQVINTDNVEDYIDDKNKAIEE